MRVLVVTHNYPRFPGDPAGAFVARLAEGLSRRGHRLLVIAPHAPGTPERETPSPELEVRRFRYAPEPLERVAYTGDLHRRALLSPLAALTFPPFLARFALAIRAAVRELDPDLIHAHWWLPGGWLAAGRGRPLVVTCHGSDIRLLERGRVVRRMARGVFERAAAVTTVSSFLARDIHRLLPDLRATIEVARMPIDTAHFESGRATPKAAPPRILYAGNLVPSKGVDLLLRAVAELRRRGVACELRILGEGPARTELEALAHELGVQSAVSWSRFLPQTAMPAEYGASTATVLPTRGQAEGLGLTLVEALCAGSAVVGSPAGGIGEVIEDECTGLLFRDGDAAHLAAQLERLLTDPALRERLVDRGAAAVRARYAIAPAVDAFQKLYERIPRGSRQH